jgi:hypothetical protein
MDVSLESLAFFGLIAAQLLAMIVARGHMTAPRPLSQVAPEIGADEVRVQLILEGGG